MQNEESYMREALREAEAALSEGEIPVGCILVRDGRIIARAHNECEATGDGTAHAEILALRRAGRRNARGATLFVTLEPCPMCAGAIALSGLKQVIYGAADPAYGCCGSVYRMTEDPAFPNYCPADGGTLKEECEAVLKDGFKKLRKQDETHD